MKKIYIKENDIKLLNEFFYRENQANADNVIVKDLDLHLWWEDSGAYPFGWFDGEVYIGDEATMHSSPTLKALYDDINDRVLHDGCDADIDGTFNDTINNCSEYKFMYHPYDVEYREEHETDEDKEDYYYEPYFNEDYYLINDDITYNHTEDELNDMLLSMDISGRFWKYDKVISFWSIMSPSYMKQCIDELSKKTNIDFSDYMYVYEDYDTDKIKYCTVADFINSDEQIEFKADDRENKGIHLMKPKEKSEALKDFKNIRGEVQGKKLGKMPMAQYHSLIYQESKNNNLQLLKEENSPDCVFIDNEALTYFDKDAHAFIVIASEDWFDVIVGEDGSTHPSIRNEIAAKYMGFNTYDDFKEYIYENEEYYEDLYGELELHIDDIRKKTLFDGRYWVNKEVITFWYKTPSTEKLDLILNEIREKLGIDIRNVKVIVGDNIIPYEDYNYWDDINNNEFKQIDSKTDEELRNIHLMNQQDKREALKDFRQNRSEIQGKKLGKMPMAQYHSLIYQESKNNNTNIITENTFESWFGNSVLVDNDGNPIKMYHGTNAKFDEFSKEHIGSTGSYEGYGFNFTPFYGRALSYNSENVIEAYLRAENPMTSKSNKITQRQLANIIAELDKGKPYTDTIVAAYEPPRYRENWDAMYYRRALPTAAKTIYEYNMESEYGDAGLYAEICINGNANKHQVIDLFERLGYDSVIFYDNDNRIKTVIVFEPNQIKLTSNKTFNNKSNIMGENVKKVYINEDKLGLLEYHAQQKLPFDDDFYGKKNQAEHYLDWLEEFGKYGKIGNSSLSLQDCVESGVKMAIEKGRIRSTDSNDNLDDSYNHIVNKLMNNKFKYITFDNRNNIYVERAIKISDSIDSVANDLFSSLTDKYENNVGGCWAFKRGMGYAYCSGENGSELLLKGWIRLEDVDWLKTCDLNYNNNEFEIRVKPNAKVELFGVIADGKYKLPLYDTLVVSSTYFGNNRTYDGDVTTVDDGMGHVTLINRKGEYLYPDLWFDEVDEFEDGFARVKIKDKRSWNFIRQDGTLLSPNQWFDKVGYFEDGLAKVETSDGVNLLKQDGTLLCQNQEFYEIYEFNEDGVAKVKSKGKYNFLKKDGKLVSPDQWFDEVGDFEDGIGVVYIKNKGYNFLKQDGTLVSPDQWFEYINGYDDYFFYVKSSDKWYKLDYDGKLYDDDDDDDLLESKKLNIKKVYINEDKLHLLKEGLYDDFNIDDADIIYYNVYQEDWGDEEEEDIQDLYNILIYDMDGNRIYENEGLLSYELDDILGEDISFKIWNNEGEPNANISLKDEYPYCLSGFNSHIFGDVNETAKKLFRNQLTEYYPKLHGYIMEDGTCIDLGYDDHNSICKIPQIKDKWEFIALGNIRCSDSFFDLIQEPTREQKYALRKLIANSNDLSVDIFGENSNSPITSAIYNGNPNPSYVLGEIDRFFNEGINLKGGYSEDDYYMYESKNIDTILENFELEVEPSDVDLSSFELEDSLNKDIWDNNHKLNSKIRLKLLDIADDFFNSLEVNFVKPIDILLTGSLCNYNWSEFSDIDLHIVVNFDEISDKTDFVKEYFDSKKNEWNNEHKELTIYDFPIELYVQNSNDYGISNGMYSLERDEWIKEPDYTDLEPINGESSKKIKKIASIIMTKIDDYFDYFSECSDNHKLEVLKNKIDLLLFKIKQLRQSGLNEKGESSIGNIVYKVLRRTSYLEDLWNLRTQIYDKLNSIN